MKKIEAITIWSNGNNKEAKILNCYAVNVTLNVNATFYYVLFAENENGTIGEQLQQGNLTMSNEEYQLWNTDNVAWDWVSTELNLTITGEYVPPAPIEEII